MAALDEEVGFTTDSSSARLPDASQLDAERKRELRAHYGWIRGFFKSRPSKYTDLQRTLNQARVGVNYDEYLTRSVQFALLGSLFGVLLGVGLTVLLSASGVLAGLQSPVAAPSDIGSAVSANRTLVVGAAVSLLAAVGIGVSTWYGRLYYPRMVVGRRRRAINVTLPHAIVYMYALSHGGMNLYEVIRELAGSQDAYGEVAREFDTVVRDTELFGNDLYTALSNARNLTPSDNLEQFLDDTLSVLDSGGDVTIFFEDEAQNYLDEAEDEQERFLETLALLSEVFIVGFVAAPLFIIVILLVMNLMGANTLFQLGLIVYAVLPLGIAGFLVLLDILSAPYVQERVELADDHDGRERFLVGRIVWDAARRAGESLRIAGAKAAAAIRREPYTPPVVTPAMRVADSHRRYRQHRRKRALRDLLYQPVVAVQRRPMLSLVGTVPLALVFAAAVALTGTATPSLAALSDQPIRTTTWLVCLPVLVAAVPLAALHERKTRRQKSITRRFPDTLNILSSANKMGISFTDALGLVSRWTSGPIGEELRLVRNDIKWNRDTAGALRSCANRLNTPRLSRTVRLIGGGLRSSSDLSKILSIAAEDTRSRHKMDRKRYRELSSYTSVVIIGFLVYLMVIILLVNNYLEPIAATPAVEAPAGQDTPISVAGIDVATYTALFYHSALVQAIGSGLIAGKLADNSLLSGLKYSILLVVLAVLAFVIV
ncbi:MULTISPECIES: type II secretion system F family protein [Salinibaculum]|uniref:type II secretion system F family protein n=1 Tax=Salinibaculum TaxID=2732368 RepID=UPI0030D389F9